MCVLCLNAFLPWGSSGGADRALPRRKGILSDSKNPIKFVVFYSMRLNYYIPQVSDAAQSFENQV